VLTKAKEQFSAIEIIRLATPPKLSPILTRLFLQNDKIGGGVLPSFDTLISAGAGGCPCLSMTAQGAARSESIWLSAAFAPALGSPSSEKGRMNLADAVQQLFTDIRDVAQIIAPIVAVIGFVCLGIMYMGSSLPFIADWKKDNPKAANQVVIGLLFVIFASSVTALITF